MANRGKYVGINDDRHIPLVAHSSAGDVESATIDKNETSNPFAPVGYEDTKAQQKKARRRGIASLVFSIISFMFCFYASAICTIPAILCAIKGYLSAKKRDFYDSELMCYWSCTLATTGCCFGVGIAALYGFLAGVQALAYHVAISSGAKCATA